MEPVLPKDKAAHPTGPLKLDDKNNIIWRATLKAGTTENFRFHYTVEAPMGKEIEFTGQSSGIVY